MLNNLTITKNSIKVAIALRKNRETIARNFSYHRKNTFEMSVVELARGMVV